MRSLEQRRGLHAAARAIGALCLGVLVLLTQASDCVQCDENGRERCLRRVDVSGTWTGTSNEGVLAVSQSTYGTAATWTRTGPLEDEQRVFTTLEERGDRQRATARLTFSLTQEDDLARGSFTLSGTSHEGFPCWPWFPGETSCRVTYKLDLQGTVGASVMSGEVTALRNSVVFWVDLGSMRVWSEAVSFERDSAVVMPPECSTLGCSGNGARFESSSSDGAFSGGSSTAMPSATAPSASSGRGSPGSSGP